MGGKPQIRRYAADGTSLGSFVPPGGGGFAFGVDLDCNLWHLDAPNRLNAKYSPSGAHLWSKSIGGAGEDFGYAVATDRNLLFNQARFNGVASLIDMPGVSGIHDLHVWTMSSERVALSAHVTLADAVWTTAERLNQLQFLTIRSYLDRKSVV